MALKDEYRIVCDTCGNVTEWNTIKPTTCPNNPEHTIQPQLTAIIKKLLMTNSLQHLVGGQKAMYWYDIEVNVWTSVRSFRFFPGAFGGVPVAFMARVGVSDSYTGDIRLRDTTNQLNLFAITGFSGEDVFVQDYTPVNIPTEDIDLELQVKSSDAAAILYVYSFSLWF